MDFIRLSVPTPGADNAYPWIGPVVISEILRYQDTLGRIWAYLELYNSSSSPVQASGIRLGSVTSLHSRRARSPYPPKAGR